MLRRPRQIVIAAEDIDRNRSMPCCGRSPTLRPIEMCTFRPIMAACARAYDRRADSAMLVDATLKHPMPPLALPRREYGEGKSHLGRARSARAQRATAWHGYTLGD
jgi:hypothetical protein